MALGAIGLLADRVAVDGKATAYVCEVHVPAPGHRPRRAGRPARLMPEPSEILTLADVEDAAARLEGIAHRTPVLTSRTLDEIVGGHVFLKAECFQRGGAFKFRGAFNRMSRLSRGELDRGVVAYSSGNHAQAVALAASLLGCPAVIVMPEDAPASKLAATKGYGAEIVPYDRYAEDREAIGRRLAEERGLSLVPPYEDPLIMAGQGTAALELVRDVPDLDDLVTLISGGGLIAGSATAGKGVLPGLRVIGVEPEAGDDTRRSLAEGRRIEIRPSDDRRRPAGAHAWPADV